MERLSAHQRRALTLIGLSLLVLVAAAAAYLGPGVLRPSAQPPASPPTSRWLLLSASFGDADHGAVTMVRTAGDGQPIIHSPATVATYMTSDGARTWRQRRPGIFMSFLDRDHAVMSYLDRRSFDITADGGRTWTSAAWPEGAVGSVRIGPAVVGMGLGGFKGPVFLDSANVWWLMARPGPAPRPVALWRSGDGGRTWTQLAASGIPNDQLVGVPTFVDQLRGAMVVVPRPAAPRTPACPTPAAQPTPVHAPRPRFSAVHGQTQAGCIFRTPHVVAAELLGRSTQASGQASDGEYRDWLVKAAKQGRKRSMRRARQETLDKVLEPLRSVSRSLRRARQAEDRALLAAVKADNRTFLKRGRKLMKLQDKALKLA